MFHGIYAPKIYYSRDIGTYAYKSEIIIEKP